MASRAKVGATTTRASSRTKTPVPPPSPPPAIKGTRSRITKPATQKAATASKTTARNPLASRGNSPDAKAAPAKKTAGTQSRVAKGPNAEQEPIMAYLRIRPQLGDEEPMSMPYLDPLSDTSVRMSDPSNDSQGNPSRARYRASTVAPSSIYKFSHVFLPATDQAGFFTKTTLPLVRDLLDGQNGLLFAYGVTNSGKTYTIQGGNEPDSAGILPRTLDVIFNSVDGLHSDGRYRPVRLYGVEAADPTDSSALMDVDVSTSEPALAEVLAEHYSNTDPSDVYTDPTVLKLDRNYEYSIWLSYAEVYNEKIYDLLASVNEGPGSTSSQIPRPAAAHPLLLTRKALTVKPSPVIDAVDESGSGSAGKYIAGLRHFRVTSSSQAKSLIKLGQLHRRVFGTLANSQSSRSHGLVTIKVLRGHRGERNDPSSLQISRLTLVDLAGSERTKHTQTTGDRLKEAGNINKSLMVLGQCMEVMRSNQKRLAQSLANPGRTDTRDVKKALAVVPFRHSKLTEVLMDYFAGDGRVVMIVNVNPYDTGFDENSHVMKFSALAREVYTATNNAPVPRILASPTKPGATSKPGPSALPIARKVTIPLSGKKISEAHLEIFEEDEEIGQDDNEDEDDDEPINPLVDALFDEIEELRLRLYEAELRCAIVEAETREEVMKEMEDRMRVMEKMYARRLMSEVERNEMKMDAKIDMLHQAGLLGTSLKRTVMDPSELDSSDETGEDDPVEDTNADQGLIDTSDDETGFDAERSPSPLAGKSRGTPTCDLASRQLVHEEMDVTGSESEVERSIVLDNAPEGEEVEGEEGEEEEPCSEDDDEDDYVPLVAAKSSRKSQTANAEPKSISSKRTESSTKPGRRSTRTKNSLSLEQKMADLSILSGDGTGADDSAIIVPNKKARQAAAALGGPSVEYVPRKGEVDTVKKKKRQLTSKAVVTEEQMERVVGAVEQRVLRSESGKNIRRMGRPS
ncbi:kinesin-domain-containing protein [Leucogyrophana mollusca]|uniref:Kinesin-domain-containing protein n=1 Tax=Leucogyrophana mollusca TaxID=85980 RepID=A0ACB8BNF3_9AGAM|nr:kinesin-domain-containing protein [Leucogyrophana mollusca]